MSEESDRKFCVDYYMRRGMSKKEAENFTSVILIGFRQQTLKVLRQRCEFSLDILGDSEERADSGL